MKTKADPTIEAGAASQNPFMPYAKPHNVIRVVYPISGGKQARTETRVSEIGEERREDIPITTERMR